jgi:DNA polymerase III alpha subunit (gram-positive type)
MLKHFMLLVRCKTFYGELVEFMSRGPIVAAILEKDNAVEDFRTLIGATNPAEAAEGTIRKAYATSIGENAVHGSDSDERSYMKVLSILLEESSSNILLNIHHLNSNLKAAILKSRLRQHDGIFIKTQTFVYNLYLKTFIFNNISA